MKRSSENYIPPAKRVLVQDPQQIYYQEQKGKIQSLINKLTRKNIKEVVVDLFECNLVYSRDVFVQIVSRSFPTQPDVIAAAVAVINSKISDIGLKLSQVLIKKQEYLWLAHLCNQRVVSQDLMFDIIDKLLDADKIQLVIDLIRICVSQLDDSRLNQVFDQLRIVLYDHPISSKTAFALEQLFQQRKKGFYMNDDLDLVEEEDQVTHNTLSLTSTYDDFDASFEHRSDFEQVLKEYLKLKADILGSSSDDEDDEQELESEQQEVVVDKTDKDVVNQRRQIYLTLMSSLDFQEACKKLQSLKAPREIVAGMVTECCSQEHSYRKFYGLIAQFLVRSSLQWKRVFQDQFAVVYKEIDKYEVNKIRNLALLFAHLLECQSIPWSVLDIIKLTEQDTSSSSRIFLKLIIEQLKETVGKAQLKAQLLHQHKFPGLFPQSNATDVRFAINYWTSIGMGILTDEMREVLDTLPANATDEEPTSKTSDSDDDGALELTQAMIRDAQ